MKRKFFSLLLALALCVGLSVPALAAERVTLLYTVQDLLDFGEQLVTDPGRNAVLMADISLEGVNWEHPLAYAQPYTGTLDGNGFTISNLSGSHSFLGTLGPGGVIQNLNLSDIDLAGADWEGFEINTDVGFYVGMGQYMGGLLDVNCGDIRNCTVTGSIDSDAYYVGGVAAEMAGGSMVNCRSYVDITFRSSLTAGHCGVGGLVGSFSSIPNREIALIDQCQFHGSIFATGPVPGCSLRMGGIVANPGIYGLIINCLNTGRLTADVWKGSDPEPAFVGGITGDSLHAVIENCANTGTIYVKSQDLPLGCNGIDGGCSWVNGTSVAGSNCWSSGSVGGESPLGDAGQTGNPGVYFLEGTNLNAGDSPTFTRAELTDGTLVGILNQYVEKWGDLPSVRSLCENIGLIMRDCRLLPWVQGPDGPVLFSAAAPTAYASTQTVLVDGKPVEFQAYALKDENGNDTNYVKLRDVAYVLNGSAAQFGVGWDQAAGAISVTGGQPYQTVGGEMSTPYSGDRSYTVSDSPLYVNGRLTSLEAIRLTDDAGNGYTYFKLRDLGEMLGFTVGWSAQTGIFLETK